MKRKILGILFALVLALSLIPVTATPVAATLNVPTDYTTIHEYAPLPITEVWVDDDFGAGTLGWGYNHFATIQDGINAVGGSTVYVAAGTYNERITLVDGVEVLGAGAGVTTINGGAGGTVVTANGVGATTKLDGFTITNGSPTSGNGGGMRNTNGSLAVVSNCIFYDNYGNATGGGMYNDNSSPTVTNCTFHGNTCVQVGGGMYNKASSPVVTNCIFWGNTGEIANDGTSSPVVSYCDVQGGYTGTGNIDADPLFVGGGDYHLQAGSPCIDAGDNDAPFLPSTDFEGDPRIWNIVVDMGVDEYLPPPTEVWVDNDYTAGGGNDGHTWGYDAFATIQDGIDAVSGSTVHVAAGTYIENITLADGVEVLGAGDDVTTIFGLGIGSAVTADGVGSGTKLDGFTIRNGSTIYGGGMKNISSSPVVSNCTFSGNSAINGGGMYNYDNSSPTVTNCTFSGNSADAYGGGMYNLFSSPTVTNCTFSGNSATNYGGGMFNEGSSPTVDNCTFSINETDGVGGGMFNYNSSPTVTNCTFSGNSASYGGGMYNEESSPTLVNCTFTGNSAVYGGGMYNNDNSSPTVTNCTFSSNSADYGGGMYNSYYTAPQVTNCTFSGNSATADGGGMENINWSSATVVNCTFYNNSATNGSGTHNDYYATPTLVNCILWDGGDEIYTDNEATPTVSYCDVQGGHAGIGNINADPLFAAEGDYHLQPTSPCIDAGNNAAPSLPDTDFEGDSRIVNGRVDMGVDESTILPPPVGGELFPVNKLSILAPWLALALLLALGGGFVVMRRRLAR